MASVEETAQLAMDNLIKELRQQRGVAEKNERMKDSLIERLQNSEREKSLLSDRNRELQGLNQELERRLTELTVRLRALQNEDEVIDEDDDDKEEKQESDDDSDESIKHSSSVIEPEEPIDDPSDSADDSIVEPLSVHSPMMNERRRMRIKIVMLIRLTIRGYFGLKFANHWGHFVDYHMCRKIHDFMDWIDYPKGTHVLNFHAKKIFGIAVSNDGHFMFTAGKEMMIAVWDLLNNCIKHSWIAHYENILRLVYDSGLLISSSVDKTIRVWNAFNYQLIYTLDGHRSSVTCIDVDRKHDLIVSGSSDKTIRLWSLKTGECLRTIVEAKHRGRGGGSLRSVYFLRDHNMIVSGKQRGSIQVWNTDNGDELKCIFNESTQQTTEILINCDESLLCCISDGKALIYSWPGLVVIQRHELDAFRGRFHPSRPDILAVCNQSDWTIRIIHVISGRQIRKLHGHMARVFGLRFTPDGSRLITVSGDPSVRIWNVSSLIR